MCSSRFFMNPESTIPDFLCYVFLSGTKRRIFIRIVSPVVDVDNSLCNENTQWKKVSTQTWWWQVGAPKILSVSSVTYEFPQLKLLYFWTLRPILATGRWFIFQAPLLDCPNRTSSNNCPFCNINPFYSSVIVRFDK